MTQLDYTKFANAVLYLLETCPARPGVVGLVKMLFFADYEHYRKHLRPITYAEYVAMPNGPVVNNYKALFEQLKQEGYIDEKRLPVPGATYDKVEYVPQMKPVTDVFSDSEIEVLNAIVHECGQMSGRAMIAKSHREGPWCFVWNESEPNRPIPYSVFRWLDNLPNDDDLSKARRTLQRSAVSRELASLRSRAA